MTLDKIFPSAKKGSPSSILRILKQNNPFKNLEALFGKAGLTKAEAVSFMERPDDISFRNLNKLLTLCELDLKLTLVENDDLEQRAEEEISDIYLAADDSWEDAMDLEEESEEDVYWV